MSKKLPKAHHRTNLSTRASRPGAPEVVVKNRMIWVGKQPFTPEEMLAYVNEALNPPPAVDI